MKKDFEQTNRIILIGNGFDKSLLMPTSYSQFLDWAVREAIKILLDTKPDTRSQHQKFSVKSELFEVISNQASLFWGHKIIEGELSYLEIMEGISKYSRQHLFAFSIEPNHAFMNRLLQSYKTDRWVDIEELYFKYLTNTVEGQINVFNEYFEMIKVKLSEYLATIQYDHLNYEILAKYRRHFFGNTLSYNPSIQNYEETTRDPGWYYFVNFNYTPFLSKLLEYSPADLSNQITINPIHGIIDGELIFGYGNETANEYLELEKMGDEFLENIKSTRYFSGTYYRDLEVFINAPYEVYIYGLSCGPSDDVLLKTILQKPNCKQIRIFYKQGSEMGTRF